MKIRDFNMIAFGPFTNKVLDLSSIENGLHIIYGPNEAGKSTSLRALIAFLYGFDHRVQDDWLHGTSRLAVGGTIELDNGEQLRLIRHKRRNNDLVDADTGKPVDSNLLSPYLVGKGDFENAYGISHESLRLGVEAVLASGGELGQTLFAATSGLNMLKGVLADLEERQKTLFAQRAQKATINQGVAQLVELQKKIKQVSAKPQDWKIRKKELEQLEQTKEKIDARLSELNVIISADTRARDALKHIPRLMQTEVDLATLVSVPVLKEDFQQQRITAQATIEQSRKAQENLLRELEQIGAHMKQLGFDEKLIANSERIEALAGDIQVHVKADKDSKVLRAKIHEADRETQRALTLLRKDLKLEEIDSLRISKPMENRIRALAKKHALLDQQGRTAQNNLAEVAPRIAKAREELGRLGQPLSTADLQSVLARLTDQGNLDAAYSDIQTETKLLLDQLHKELAALGWRGNLEAFESASFPPDETMRRFAGNLDQCRLGATTIETEIQRLHQAILDKQKELATLTAARDLPAPEDLTSRRELRDQGWRSVRSVWLEDGEPDPAFLSSFPGRPSLADAYEQSVKEADETADILRTDAQAVAIAHKLRTEVIDIEQQNQARQQQREDLEQQQQRHLTQWRELWRPLGIEPFLPSEMLEWSQRAETVKRSAIEYYKKAARMDQLETLIKSINTILTDTLNRLGINTPSEASHTTLVDLARRTIDQNQRIEKQRQEIALRLEDLIERQEIAQRQIAHTEQDARQWLVQWTEAISPLHLPVATEPEMAIEYVDALNAILARYDEAKRNQSRIDAIERNRKDFRQRVQETVADLAPQLAQNEPEQAAEALKVLLKEHLEQRQRFEHLAKDLREKQKKLDEEQEKTAGTQEILHQLCIQATVTDPEQLPDVERQSKRKSELLRIQAEVKERLSELAGGQPLQAFIEQVGQQDPDAIAAALEKNELEKDDLHKNREELVAGIALSQNALKQYDGRSQAAILAVEAHGLTGRLQTDVEQYIKLHMASLILAKAIERYRKENESPILEAASQYFRIMTRDAFAGLRADFDDKGNPVIKAVRASDNMALKIEEMSDGSRDQLFLSLRLGSLSRHLEADGGMPFIVDDVLVNFDDHRAAATFEAMMELAGKTQLIFFTHHQHLVELAKSTLKEEILKVHLI